jgi:hypothetical protein
MALLGRLFLYGVIVAALSVAAQAASKPHVIAYGRLMTVKVLTGPSEDTSLDMRIRPLFVDGMLKVYVSGLPHEITDHQFAVQRIARVNDELPSEGSSGGHWIWKLSGWIVVDRTSGRLAPIALPDYDAEYSAAWYRDYVAYCGISEDGGKVSAIVMEVGRRKPLLKKTITETKEIEGPVCATPVWQRQPPRVTFLWKPDQKATYKIRGAVLEIRDADEDETQ